MTPEIRDEQNRYIAPPQTVIADRPMGAWDNNARPDGSWAGKVECAWCKTTMRDGNPALATSHGICRRCEATLTEAA